MSNSRSDRKVVHVITGLNDGGAEGVLARLCLHSKQAQHVVVSLMDAGKYGPLLAEAGVAVHCLGMKSGIPSAFKFIKLIRLIKSEDPDVVQTWMYHADLLGGIAARLAGVRRVFWGIRRSSLEKGKSSRLTLWLARSCALLSKWVPEKVICCANKALTVHAEVGYQKSKLLVIPNGYDLAQFKSDCTLSESVRIEFCLGSDLFVLGNVARFDPLKDHSNLLQALAQVAEQRCNFRCLLVGRGMSTDNAVLKAGIFELGLQEKVILAGQRRDIPAIMNALDLHVLSSCSEGFPNVLAEAMACGTPCVTTNVGDALEIIGDAGLCCPPSNPKALADVILKMHNEWQDSPEAWQRHRAASAQRIADRFSIGGMVARYEACWFGKTRYLA
ncbi:glycosyltransferase [Marinobacteraceae bacterium S3BR75-40.1]